MQRLVFKWLGLGVFLSGLCSLWGVSLPSHASQPGAVVAWGAMKIPYVPPGSRYQAIAAGGVHTLALTTDGKVVAWGAMTMDMRYASRVTEGGGEEDAVRGSVYKFTGLPNYN